MGTLHWILVCTALPLVPLLVVLRKRSRRRPPASYFSGKVIWITGASSGLGEQLALAAAEGGAHGIILSGRREAALERVQQACVAVRPSSTSTDVRVLTFDMGELDTSFEQAKKAVAEFGRIDALVLNAGVSTRASVEDTSIEVAKRVMAVNYFGAIGLAKGLLDARASSAKNTRATDVGRVHFVVINSVQGKFGVAYRSSYSASKHALVGFFDSLRAEMGCSGVRVTSVFPGYIRTSLSINALTGDGSQHAKMDATTESGRDPRDVADIIWSAVANGEDEVVIADLKVKLAILLRTLAPRVLFGILSKMALKGPS